MSITPAPPVAATVPFDPDGGVASDNLQDAVVEVAARTSYGAYSSRPAAGTAGKLYVATDAPVGLWVDTGSAWAPLIGGQVPGVQPKAASNFTATNAVAACTLVDRKGALHLAKTADSSAQTVRPWVESLSSSTAKVECAVNYGYGQTLTNAFPGVGLCMRESSTGKLFIFIVSYNSSNAAFSNTQVFLEASRWTNHTTRSAAAYASTWFGNGPKFLRLRVSGSNILAEVSTDRQNWSTVNTTALTTAFTTAPDQVGLVLVNWVANEIVAADVTHYYSVA
jgi:hypothetical protein